MSLKDILLNQKDDGTVVNEENISENIFLFVGNVPKALKSADLRFFFKTFVEKAAFECFHYRHRPETQVVVSEKCPEPVTEKSETCCCVVKLGKDMAEPFIEKYHGKEWCCKERVFHGKHVNIKKLKIKNKCLSAKYKSNRELREDKHDTDQDVYLDDLKIMIEMNPPELMPNGNVGTPTKHFHQLIRQCKLPSTVIKSLALEFPKHSSKYLYKNVPLDYGSSKNPEKELKTKQTSFDETINNRTPPDGQSKSSDSSVDVNEDIHDLGEDHEAEDWERHEALHDDVDNQSRPKERLFEEDLEVKWEKGGSGLVFYTDAYYWNEMKGKDFDEDTVDDWDVDYSIYYEDGAGDKPARDFLQMQVERRRREGKGDGPVKYSQIRRKEKFHREKMTKSFAAFEKHSKGFGSRILKKQGWAEGSGVGSSREGISEPIDLNGKTPRERTGLGYYGEKLERAVSLKRRAERDVYISTKYDEKDGEEMNGMRYHGKELLKYRPVPVDFKSQKNCQESQSTQEKI